MAAVLTAEAIRSGVDIMENMMQSDLVYLDAVANQAGLGPSGDSALRRFPGEGHCLPAGGPHTFTGAHGTMRPIDVVDDDSDIPAGQPEAIVNSQESVVGYVEAEQNRQASGSFSDVPGDGAVPLAADSVPARPTDSVGAIGVGAEEAGLWAPDTDGAGTPAEFPLTQAYDDDGVNRVGSADPPANLSLLAESLARPIANIPALAEVEVTDFADLPSLAEWDDDDEDEGDGRGNVVRPGSLVCSEAESSASTRAPSMSSLPPVTYFPSFGSLPIPRCFKCGREVDPIVTRQTGKADGKSGGRWKCPACNTRHVQACSMFGEWPTDDFLDLDEKSQKKFWTEPGHTKKELEQNVLKNVIRCLIQRRTAENRATYQPLSWYGTQGYDMARIEREITDTKEFKGLGLCYKVWFEGESLESIDEQCSKKLKDMKEGKDRIKAAKKQRIDLASGASASSAVAPDRKRSRSSSSDSSSSSTQPRKKRKAERKAAEKRKAAEPEITPEELAKQKAAEEKKQKLADKEAAKIAKERVQEDKKKQGLRRQLSRRK